MKLAIITVLAALWATVLVNALPNATPDGDHDGHHHHHHDGGDDDDCEQGSAPAIPVHGVVHVGSPSPPSPVQGGGDDEDPGPKIPVGRPRGPVVPSSPHVNLTLLGENNLPRSFFEPEKRQQCGGGNVLFNTSTVFGNGGQPPEPSGARAGQIVFSTANFLAAISLDGGVTFDTINPTVYSGPANPATDGGFCCDQIVQYLPSIDRFVWLIQYWGNAKNVNKLRIITFHPADLDANGINAWLYVDVLSTDLKLTNKLDAGELAVGNNWLWLASTNTGTGLVVAKIPISALNAVGTFTYWYSHPSDGTTAYLSRLSQNPGDTLFWAGHTAFGTTMRIFRWPESATTFAWSDIRINDWPSAVANFVSNCPNSTTNWVFSAAFATVLGSTRRSTNEVWFAWAAPSGGGFPNVHIQVAQINTESWPTISLVRQWQVWNPSFAFLYPAFYTNDCGDVGLAVMFGGGNLNPTSALGIADSDGILTQTVYYPELSDVCENRNGDYLTVRSGNGFNFEGYVYAEQSTEAGGIQRNVRYVEFHKG